MYILGTALEQALSQSSSPRVAEIDDELEATQKELLQKANAKQGIGELADKIDSLRAEKQTLLMEDANRTAMKERFEEIEAFLEEQVTGITEYDEGLVRRLIERIIVYDDHLVFEFKTGIEIEVKM